MLREIRLPNPTTPGNSTQMPQTILPVSGPITVTATVTRDPGDDSPVTVRLVNGTTVLGSTNLTTPAGPGNVSFSFDVSLLGNDCDFAPTIEVIPCEECVPVVTPCCPEGISSRLTIKIINRVELIPGWCEGEEFDFGEVNDTGLLEYHSVGTGPLDLISTQEVWSYGYWYGQLSNWYVVLVCSGEGEGGGEGGGGEEGGNWGFGHRRNPQLTLDQFTNAECNPFQLTFTRGEEGCTFFFTITEES